MVKLAKQAVPRRTRSVMPAIADSSVIASRRGLATRLSPTQMEFHWPDFSAAAYNRGLAYYKLGKLEAAAASFAQALTVSEAYPEAYLRLGYRPHGRQHAARCSNVIRRIVVIVFRRHRDVSPVG